MPKSAVPLGSRFGGPFGGPYGHQDGGPFGVPKIVVPFGSTMLVVHLVGHLVLKSKGHLECKSWWYQVGGPFCVPFYVTKFVLLLMVLS